MLQAKSEIGSYRINIIAMFMIINVRSNLHKKIYVLGLFIVNLNVVSDNFTRKSCKVKIVMISLAKHSMIK